MTQAFLIIFLAIAEISFCDQWNGDAYHANSPEQRHAAASIIAQLWLQGNERVLDVGCGDGYNTSLLLAKVPNGSALGIDLSPSMIAFACSKYEYQQLAFELMGANELNFESEFDLAVSFSMFHWIKDAQDAMQRIYTENDSKVGNFARRLLKFFDWSERPGAPKEASSLGMGPLRMRKARGCQKI